MYVSRKPLRTVARIAACIAATALGACAVGPDFEAPSATLPAQWDANQAPFSDAEVDEAWWRQFDDPLLTELIVRARESNLDLQIAALRVAQSRAQRNVAAGAAWPSVNASAGYRRERQSEYGVGTRIIDSIGGPIDRDAVIDVLSEPFDVYQAGFDAAWELDLWGRVRRRIEAADATLAATSEELHAAQLSLLAEVARTYFELRGAQDQLRIAQQDVAVSEDALALARQRAEGGLVTQLDVVSQRARLAEGRSRIPQLHAAVERLIHALSLLVGAAPDALAPQLSSPRSAPASPKAVGLGVPSQAARRRPDIRAAEARLHAATAEIGVARAELYPQITLAGGLLFQSLEASDLSEWGARQWTIGPSLSLPLFDGGRLRAVVQLRELQQQEAAVNYQRTVLHAWHEIEDALTAYAAELRRREQLADALSASREAYEIARIRYDHGLTSFLVALDAQRTWLSAQRAYSDSATATAAQLIAIYKALGGGWENERNDG